MRLLITAFACLLLSACVSLPSDYDKARQFIPGQTTISEARQVLGPPNSISDMGDGTVLYQWMDTSPYSAEHIALLFEKGKFVRISHASRF